MMRRFTAALLSCLMLLGLLPTAMAAQVSDQQIIDTVLDFLYVHEGNYGSINPNDNGALSVGKIQWHGANALALCRDIVTRNPEQALEILGEELYTEITDSATDWSTRTVDEEEAALLSTLLTTPEGRAAQDDQGRDYMTRYIKSARNQGLTDPTIIVYYCDMYNQSPRMAMRVTNTAAEAAGSASAVTLDLLYQTALEDEVAGKYASRRTATYEYCKSLGWSSTVTPAKVKFPKVAAYKQGQFYDVAASEWYTTNVARAVEFGLMNGLGTGAFKPNGNVTVAQAVTMAARIHSIYTNGSADFEQTPGAQWYKVYFDYAYQNGILTASYHWNNANQPATRAQFAEIFAKALPAKALPAKNTVKDNAIPDVPTSASYAGAVYTLYRAGILTGNDASGRFTPKSYITRAQVAAIASRMADSDLRMSVPLK